MNLLSVQLMFALVRDNNIGAHSYFIGEVILGHQGRREDSGKVKNMLMSWFLLWASRSEVQDPTHLRIIPPANGRRGHLPDSHPPLLRLILVAATLPC